MTSPAPRCSCMPCTFGAFGQCDAKRPDLGQLDVAALARVLARLDNDQPEETDHMNTLRLTMADGTIEEAPCRIGDDQDDCGWFVVYWDGLEVEPSIGKRPSPYLIPTYMVEGDVFRGLVAEFGSFVAAEVVS